MSCVSLLFPLHQHINFKVFKPIFGAHFLKELKTKITYGPKLATTPSITNNFLVLIQNYSNYKIIN
jgi:hypothetical protein